MKSLFCFCNLYKLWLLSIKIKCEEHTECSNISFRHVFSYVFCVGYAWAEDKEHCEEYGRMLQADPSKVSFKAKKRGLPQVSKDNLL